MDLNNVMEYTQPGLFTESEHIASIEQCHALVHLLNLVIQEWSHVFNRWNMRGFGYEHV